MSSWKGKTRGGVAGYRFFIFLLKYPGLRFSYFFLRFVVLYYVLFVPTARKPIFYYFNHILGYTKIKSFIYLFKNNYKLGQVLLDKVAFLSGFAGQFTFDFEGEEYIHQMASEGGGFLFGAHIGNWEIAGQLLERINTRVHIVMLEAEHEKIKAMLDDVMTKKSMHIIPVKDDFSHLIKINEALSKNELIAIHGDRFLQGSKTITGKLLGFEAEFPYGPFYMAIKYQRPVTFVSAAKETNTHYHFYATKPVLFDQVTDRKKLNNQIQQLLNKYTSEMDRILKIYPEQWFNYYYFWSLPK